MRWIRFLSAAAMLLATCSATYAAEVSWSPNPSRYNSVRKGVFEVIDLSVSPVRASRSAAKYHLLPEYLEQTPGNAVPIYMKAFLVLAEKKDTKSWEKIREWVDMPLEKLPREEVRKTLERYQGVFDALHVAVRRERCDWEPPFREDSNRIFAMPIPEIQQTRWATWLLIVRAELAAAEKRQDDVLASLQTGYAMARHTAESPLLASRLYAITLASIMTDELQALVETSPDAPSLYWAVTALPRPLVSVRSGVEYEGHALYRMFPEMEPARRRHHVPEHCEAILTELRHLAQQGTGAGGLPDSKADLSPANVERLAPDAKAHLLAAGYAKDVVEGMSPVQAVVSDMFEIYETCRDDLFKWLNVPYGQAREEIKRLRSETKTASKHPELRMLAEIHVGMASAAHFAEVRTERKLATLRVIEAIRLYAGAHDGKLPAKLDDIHEVPVPVNPATGTAFGYRQDGDTAILDDNGEGLQRQYRVKLAK